MNMLNCAIIYIHFFYTCLILEKKRIHPLNGATLKIIRWEI